MTPMTSRRARAAAAALLCGLMSFQLAGCGAAAMTGALTPPEAGGAAWVEASSPHFIVDSDLPAAEAGELAEELERIYSTLSDLGFPYEAKPPDRTRVVVFQREIDYKAVAPRDMPGFFTEAWIAGDQSEPVAVLSGSLTRRTREVLQHELTQRFVRFYYPEAPAWISAGLAHYFETMAVEDGQAILGRPTFAFRKGLIWEHSVVATSQNTGYGMFAYRLGSRSAYGQIPTGQVPPARTILRLDRGGFLPDPEASGSRQKELKDHQRVLLNRAGAWGLVHLLRNGPERYRRRFEQLLSQLGQGQPFSAAWDAVFKPEEMDQLDRDLLAWLVRPNREVVTLRTAYAPKPAHAEAPRAMSPAEVHLLWAGLRPQALASELAAAARADPEHPAVKRAQARLLAQQGERERAEAPLAEEGPAAPQAAAPGLSDSVVRTIVQRRHAGYDQCYAAGLARDAGLSGKVIVRFVVETDGAVSGAKDGGSTLRDQEVLACVLGEIQKLRFPAREGGAAAEVVYPILFNLPDPTAEGAGHPSQGQSGVGGQVSSP